MFDRLIRDLLAKDPTYSTGGPVRESLVISAEEKLGLRFPESLRVFALSYGYIIGPGGHISVVAPRDDLTEQGGTAYQLTIFAREAGWVEPTFIVLEGDDYPPICIDTAVVTEEGKCPVFCYHHFDSGEKRERIADDFADYLHQWLAVRLEKEA